MKIGVVHVTTEAVSGPYTAMITANLDRAHLGLLYRDAKIFWHAAGMKSDETIYPELAEHFGISTVEAMSAGCVPVALRRALLDEYRILLRHLHGDTRVRRRSRGHCSMFLRSKAVPGQHVFAEGTGAKAKPSPNQAEEARVT